MRIDIITIFPEYFSPLRVSLLGKAAERGIVEFGVHDLRAWAHDTHRTVDDAPFGGGPGMVMTPAPWGAALDAVTSTASPGARLVVPTPSGIPFRQEMAAAYPACGPLVFACGRYEGIDARVIEDARTRMAVDEVSIGDYVLSGGEPAALVMIDAVGRLLASRAADRIWAAAVAIVAALAIWRIAHYAAATLTVHDVVTALALGGITFVRVAVLIALASAIWVPVGIYVGLRPRLATAVQPVAQFLAAFPANLLFPAAVVGIVQFRLDPDIWLSPLMILGTQWYVLFNVVAGAAAIPGDLRDVAANLGLRGWVRWRKTLLPAVFPYYVTGAITATGGSWNASIVAEVASWGRTRLAAHGIGAYIAQATAAGDHARIVLGIAVMSGFVIVVNRVVWRPLYAYAERRVRLALRCAGRGVRCAA